MSDKRFTYPCGDKILYCISVIFAFLHETSTLHKFRALGNVKKIRIIRHAVFHNHISYYASVADMQHRHIT